MEIIDMSTMTTLTNEVSKVEDNLRDYNNSLNNLLCEIVPVIRQLVNDRNDRLTATEPTGDFVGSLATLMARVDELENTTSGMAVMKLQDAIDETQESCGDHEERLDELHSRIEDIESDVSDIDRRLDDATITI